MYIIATILLIVLFVWRMAAKPVNQRYPDTPSKRLLGLSEELLYNVKTQAPTDSVELILSGLPITELITGLNNDQAKKTFWINIYNAWYQLLASRNQGNKTSLFSRKLIPIAGHNFTLDDIEHGILRKYRWKLSMGYLPQFLPSRLIKQLAVSTIDYRIHFALNCGAKSCPPIAFYKYEKIERQLEMATASFLQGETQIDSAKHLVETSKILYWFKADFGGKKGILALLSKVLKKDMTNYSLRFNKYSWDEHLQNFIRE